MTTKRKRGVTVGEILAVGMVVAIILLALFVKFAPYLTSSHISQVKALGHDCRVRLFCPNGHVEEWRSNGRVSTESGSDGWFFADKATDRLVRLSGSVAVEELSDTSQWQPAITPTP